jgi:sulfite exporter TauE/SafE
MEIWSGLVLGFLGSLHCAGMCGPLALALPRSTGKTETALRGLTFHAGKALAYGILGAVVATLGLPLSEYQRTLSVILGLILLAAVWLPGRMKDRIFQTHWPAALVVFKNIFQTLIRRSSFISFFGLGFLNGFLPCGLVYVALAGALLQTSTAWGFMYMVLFGLGTLPMLLTIYMAGHLIHTNRWKLLKRMIPAGMSIIAILLILRGLSLGIPYVSPVISSAQATSSCCR